VNNWNAATKAEKLVGVREWVILKGTPYSEFANAVGTTKNAIAGFVHANRRALSGLDPLPKVYQEREGAPASSYHTEADYTEKWTPKQKAVRVHGAMRGRPTVWNDDKRRDLRAMWVAGTQIKIIAETLGVGEKAVKDERLRQKLATRRPNLGNSILFRLQLTADDAKLLRTGARRRGSTKADFLRYLIRRNEGNIT
jgi:hypothetical protein